MSSCDGTGNALSIEFYEERCTPPTNPMTLYECISVLVRWFYINTPLFGYGGASYDVICNRLNHNNVTIDECKLYINSIVYQRTDIFLTTCVCVIAVVIPYIFKMYNKTNETTLRGNTRKKIHIFACKVVSLVSMEGVESNNVVASIKSELNQMDNETSRKIGKQRFSYHIADRLIPFMNREAVEAIMQRCLDTSSYEYDE